MIDKSDFLSIVEANKRSILGVCRFYASLNSTLSVDDLFQEIVLNLWKSYGKYVKTPDCKTSTWIYRVAINVSISQIRKIKNLRFTPIDIKEIHSCSIEEHDENKEYLYHLINLLEEEDQEIVFLYLKDKPYQEIANILGISVSNVGTKIQRIKLKLKNLCNEEL